MASDLVLINSTTCTTGAQTEKISDVFSNDYKLYMIVGADIIGQNSTASGCNMRLVKASDDSVETGTVYEYAQYNLKAEATFNDSVDLNDTRWFNIFGSVDDGAQVGAGVAYISMPFQSQNTYITYESQAHVGGPNFRSYHGAGVIQNTTSYSGITVDLNESASRFAGGTVSIYGII